RLLVSAGFNLVGKTASEALSRWPSPNGCAYAVTPNSPTNGRDHFLGAAQYYRYRILAGSWFVNKGVPFETVEPREGLAAPPPPPPAGSGGDAGRPAPALDEQVGDQAGPAGLVGRPQAGAGVAVEVLVEGDQVVPSGIALEELAIAEHGPPAAPV